jgi:hypothetical protein
LARVVDATVRRRVRVARNCISVLWEFLKRVVRSDLTGVRLRLLRLMFSES